MIGIAFAMQGDKQFAYGHAMKMNPSTTSTKKSPESASSRRPAMQSMTPRKGETTLNDRNLFITPGAELVTEAADASYEPRVFSFRGRLGRLRYVVYLACSYLLLFVVWSPLAAIAMGSSLAQGEEPELTVLVGIAIACFIVGSEILSIMFAKRRLNDLNHSGWYVLVFFAPLLLVFVESILWIGQLASLLLSIYLLYFPGSANANKFGPVPSKNSTLTSILGLLIHLLLALVFLSVPIGLSILATQQF